MSCSLCGSLACDSFFATNRHFFRCGDCGLVFVNSAEHISPLQELERYNHHNNSLQNQGYEKYLRHCFEVFASNWQRGESLLDFGSGKDGPLGKIAAALGFSCTSYDLFYQNDPMLLAKSFDGIFCLETCEHFRDPWQEFSLLHSMLKPGGAIAIRTEFLPLDFANWFYHRDPTHICFYSEATFSWLAKSLGFEILLCHAPFVLLKKI